MISILITMGRVGFARSFHHWCLVRAEFNKKFVRPEVLLYVKKGTNVDFSAFDGL